MIIQNHAFSTLTKSKPTFQAITAKRTASSHLYRTSRNTFLRRGEMGLLLSVPRYPEGPGTGGRALLGRYLGRLRVALKPRRVIG